jgi:hypothetical protein
MMVSPLKEKFHLTVHPFPANEVAHAFTSMLFAGALARLQGTDMHQELVITSWTSSKCEI